MNILVSPLVLRSIEAPLYFAVCLVFTVGCSVGILGFSRKSSENLWST